MTASLINKYRPQSFDDVVGHAGAVSALEDALKRGTAQAFLFTGGSGFGKTTLARIVAQEAGCLPHNLLEIDAATNTGIDAMREATATLQYQPLGEESIKAVIVDECHALSKPASQSLLKILEEPPEWVYWLLCTTEPTRILPTLRTRCLHIDLKPVPSKVLEDWLFEIAQKEKLGKGIDKIVELCAREAQGSPRQALSNLAVCGGAKTLDEARGLLSSADGAAEAVDLARLLARRAKWPEVQELLKRLKDTDSESVRRVVQAYLTTIILNSKRESDAGGALEILDAFSQPFYHHSGLVLACGKVLLSEES